MHSLLLGGSGFIGTPLSLALHAAGDTVMSVSLNGETPSPDITGLALNLYEHPIPAEILAKADRVFILLGQMHATFDAEQEKQLIADLATKLTGVKTKVIYFSTVYVYGESPVPATEDDPLKPYDAYSAFKAEAEQILRDTLPADRLTILRLSNVYGSPRNKGFVGFVMNQLMTSEPTVKLNGNGEQLRDYIIVDDVVNAVVAVAQSPETGAVNIATGTSYSLKQLVDLASAISGKKVQTTVLHNEITEAQDCLISNARLRDVFGYTRFTPLKAGLALTYKRYQEIA